MVRYFAYGANVAPASMSRRGTAPAGSARPATVKDYRLTFGVPGAPYVEPGFATIVRKDEAGEEEDGGLDVRGVVYDLTEEDWERVRATETGYEVVEVEGMIGLADLKELVIDSRPDLLAPFALLVEELSL